MVDFSAMRKERRKVKREFSEKGKGLDPLYEKYIAVKVYGLEEYAQKLSDALGYDRNNIYKALQGNNNFALYEIHLHLQKVLSEKSEINIQQPVTTAL